MDAFSISATKESEKLSIMLKPFAGVSNKLQRDHSENFDRMNALMQSTSDNF